VKVNDAITGAVLVVFAVAEIAYTRTFPSLHGQSYGPNLFPSLIGAGLAGCGLILILRGLVARRAESGPASSWIDFGNIAQSRHASCISLYLYLSVRLDWLYPAFNSYHRLFVISIGFIDRCVPRDCDYNHRCDSDVVCQSSFSTTSCRSTAGNRLVACRGHDNSGL